MPAAEYSEKAFSQRLKETVAWMEKIPTEEVRDDTPVVDPEALVMQLTLYFGRFVICENILATTTFRRAKENIRVG
jgi:hypothetical protein